MMLGYLWLKSYSKKVGCVAISCKSRGNTLARDTALSAGAVIRDALEKCILTEAAGLDIHLVLSYMHCIVLINIVHVYAKSALEEKILLQWYAVLWNGGTVPRVDESGQKIPKSCQKAHFSEVQCKSLSALLQQWLKGLWSPMRGFLLAKWSGLGFHWQLEC